MGASFHVATIYQAIQDEGGTLVKYTEYAGFTHTAAMNRVHSEDGVLQWLLSQKRYSTSIHPRNRNFFHDSQRFVSTKNGRILLSAAVPDGAVLTLYNSRGQMLHRSVVTMGQAQSIPLLPATYWQLQIGNDSFHGVLSKEP